MFNGRSLATTHFTLCLNGCGPRPRELEFRLPDFLESLPSWNRAYLRHCAIFRSSVNKAGFTTRPITGGPGNPRAKTFFRMEGRKIEPSIEMSLYKLLCSWIAEAEWAQYCGTTFQCSRYSARLVSNHVSISARRSHSIELHLVDNKLCEDKYIQQWNRNSDWRKEQKNAGRWLKR